MKQKIVYILPLILAFLFVGCSIKPNSDEFSQIDRYRLLVPKISKVTAKPLDKSIKVALPVAPKFLYTDKVAYMKKDGSFGFFQFSKWDESVAKQLQFIFASSLEQSNLYKNIIISPSLIREDFLLESRIDKLIYIYDETNPMIDIKITLFLIEAKSKKVLKSTHLLVSQKVENSQPKKVILGFHRAVRVLNQKLINWLKN